MKKRASLQSPPDRRPDARPSNPSQSSTAPPPRRFGPRPDFTNRPPAPKPPPKEKPPAVKRVAKATELTPELREQITQQFQQAMSPEKPLKEIIAQLSDKFWINRKQIGQVIHETYPANVEISEETKAKIIELYAGYVARSERPEGGRRRTIAKMFNIPLRQVRNLLYEWSLTQYKQSPTPELSRTQRFEIEKLYWAELENPRLKRDEIPDYLAQMLGYVNAYQISRWFDTLHDDEARHANIPDPSPEITAQIIEAYKQYLAAPQPPDQGLHFTLANQIGNVNQRQVHKVLQRFRNQRRAAYPLS